MSMLRTCPNCKWQYPPTYTNRKCKHCKTEFNEFWCRKCETYKPQERFSFEIVDNKKRRRYVCRNCEHQRLKLQNLRNPESYKARSLRATRSKVIRMHKKYEDWLDRTNASFKILSESEWYAACKHFGGCAICGNESIEARAFFVPFGDGGRYTAWNIIPACGKCGVEAKINDNPFKWMTGLNAKNVGLTTERANKIIAYLEQQIEKVME